MHPFVALMKKYCIDYTNSHDQTLYDEIMEPDYVVNINGMQLVRSTTYAASVEQLFDMCPGLGLVVHRFVLNEDRLCMYFSEHTSMPGAARPDALLLAGHRSVQVERRPGSPRTSSSRTTPGCRPSSPPGSRIPSLPPHIDPWTTTEPVPSDAEAETIVRDWLARGDLTDAEQYEIDDTRTGAPVNQVIDVESMTVNDLFSAGSSVPFHVTWKGTYRGGLGDELAGYVGDAIVFTAVGIAEVANGRVEAVDAITGRLQVVMELTGVTPEIG